MNQDKVANSRIEETKIVDPAKNYKYIRDLITALSHTHHRTVPPELLAVSKGHSYTAIRALAALGQVRFGENYAQELLDKAAQNRDENIEFVFIGHLQSNKINKIVGAASEIQTVGNFEQAKRIAKAAKLHSKIPFPIYIQVNADDESGKHGVTLDELEPLYHSIKSQLPELIVKGVMAIPSLSHAEAFHATGQVSNRYIQLRQKANHIGQGCLSLGTSSDIELAILAGSNELRIGTALFGPRKTKIASAKHSSERP